MQHLTIDGPRARSLGLGTVWWVNGWAWPTLEAGRPPGKSRELSDCSLSTAASTTQDGARRAVSNVTIRDGLRLIRMIGVQT
jgi:hypothetical protein